MKRWAVLLLYFASGLVGLMYELLWLRKLALILGNTTLATSAILASFMTGLALGSWYFGTKADYFAKPLKIYAYLELAVAICALGILFLLLPISDALYGWIFSASGTNNWLVAFTRVALAVILLSIPTTLMGGTFPVISKLFATDDQKLGNQISALYAVNTAGGVLGVFLTGYIFISMLGVRASYYIAVGINILVAILALHLSRLRWVAAPKQKTDVKTFLPEHLNQTTLYSKNKTKLSVLIFAVSGFTSLAYEVVFTRALLFYISSTTYSFTIMLATFLLGIMLGSMLLSRYIHRLRNLFFAFGLAELTIGITSVMTIMLFKHMDSYHLRLLSSLISSNFFHVNLLLFATAALILLPPTFAMGTAFPLAVRIYVPHAQKAGRGVGFLYMCNTIGSIVGSLACGFILIPLLGLNATILSLSLVNAVLALILIGAENLFTKHRAALMAGAAAAFGLTAILFYERSPVFNSSGAFQNTRVLASLNSSDATICVLEHFEKSNIWGENVRFINVNGHNTAHTTFSDMIIHKMLAHLPMLIHPAPEKALVIGFGFGNTCHSFLQYDGLKQLDCVELVAEEKRTSEYFSSFNKGVWDDDRFRFLVNDGRNYIKACSQQYDVISINSVDPKFSPTLYTTEFYQLCRNRLRERGQIVVWLPIYGMSLQEVQSLTQSFLAVFPHSSLWYNNPEHLLLLGSTDNCVIDVGTVKSRIRVPAVLASLSEVFLQDPFVFLSTFWCSEDKLRSLANQEACHTDDKPLVEFSKVVTNDMAKEIYGRLLQVKESIVPYCSGWAATQGARSDSASLYDLEMSTAKMIGQFFRYRIEAGEDPFSNSTKSAVSEMLKLLDSSPFNPFILVSYVDLINHSTIADNKKHFEKALTIAPRFIKVYNLLGLQLMGEGKWNDALVHFTEATELNPGDLTSLLNAGVAYLNLNQWKQAELKFQKALSLQAENLSAHLGLSQCYYLQHDYPAAIEQAKKAILLQPNIANNYFNLGMMLIKSQQRYEAMLAFEKGLKLNPLDTRAKAQLQKLRDGKAMP